ncbi:MAG: hypothetical protein ACQ5SW_02205 [Sphaerochaetaceae bacterium]
MNLRVVFRLVRAFFSGTKPLRSFYERIRIARSRILNGVTSTLFLLVFLSLACLLAVNYYSYQTLGLLMGIPYLGLLFASVMAFAFQFLYSLAGGVSLLYGGKDILLVGSLAVRHRELGASRLLIAYFLYAPLYWFVSLPALVVGLWIDGFSLLYLTGALLFLLVGPLFSLSLSVVLSLLLVRLTKGRNHKREEALVSMVAMMLLILILTVSFTRNIPENGTYLSFNYELMMQSYGPIIEKLIRIFPLFRIQAMMVSSLSAQLVMVAIGFVLAAFLVLLVGGTYAGNLSYVLSNQVVSKIRKGPHSFRAISPQRALMKRELLIIRSESAFVFEVFGELGIPLLLLVLYGFMGILDELQELISGFAEMGITLQLLYVLLLLFANISLISSTSVSRQGKLFILDKQYPLDASIFVQAKVRFHLVLVSLPHILYLTAALVLLSFPLIHLLWMVPLSLLCIGIVACLHLAIDYRHPRLDWKVSQQAMKSNPNGLIGMGISLVISVLFALFLFLPTVLGIPTVLSIFLLFFASSGILYGSYRLVLREARLLLSR